MNAVRVVITVLVCSALLGATWRLLGWEASSGVSGQVPEGWVKGDSAGTGDSDSGSPGTGDPTRVVVAAGLEMGRPWRPELISEMFSYGAHVDRLSRVVHLHRHERVLDPAATSGWTQYASERAYSVSYEPLAVSMRDSRDLVVAGKSDNGNFVLESWRVPSEQGSYEAVRSVAEHPVGLISQRTLIAFGISGGGSFELPENRSPVTPRRQLIYRGDLIDGCKGVALDPGGRYVVVLDRGDAVWQIDFSVAGQPPTVAELTGLLASPQVLARCARPLIKEHTHEGRKIVMGSAIELENPPYFVVFTDRANDGVFDYADVISYPEALASAHGRGQWLDDFVHYSFYTDDPRY